MTESLLVECAQWIYKNKKRVEDEGKDVWWTPYSLTNLNVDKTNPQIPINDSFEVFMELVRRRLAIHDVVWHDQRPFPIFKMLLGRDEEWQNLIRKKGLWELKVKPLGILLIKKSWLVVVFAFSAVIANGLGELARYYAREYLIPPQVAPSTPPTAPQTPQTPNPPE